MPKPKEESLTQLQVIRTETVLSKFPIHNLAKQKKTNIKIAKKDERGQIKIHWEVSYNSKYGPPGQLAYKIDTLIVNRRIDEAGRPVPKVLSLGSQSEIYRELHSELDLSQNSKDITKVKKALYQNAGAFIDVQSDYKGKDGTRRHLEAGFTRYNVIFTGESLPDGRKADAVHIILDDIFQEVINNAPVRPLNYSYLKKLPPSAQRFYEIISYRIFAAINRNHGQAKLLYSEYCMFSAQTRYYDYNHFKKQMYKVHKPHLVSDYIEKVEYQQQTDSDGKIDWVMIYTPGSKANAEYRAFNSKRLFEGEIIDIGKKESKRKSNTEKQPIGKRSTPNARANTAKPSSTQTAFTSEDTLQIVQYFHHLACGIENYHPYRNSKENKQAQELLCTYGTEKARFIVAFAATEAKKTNFQMRNFGAIFQYVSDAVQAYEREARERERQRAQEGIERQQEEKVKAWTDARLNSIPKDQYQVLYEKTKAHLLSELPSMAAYQETAMFQSFIKETMIRELDKQEGGKQ